MLALVLLPPLIIAVLVFALPSRSFVAARAGAITLAALATVTLLVSDTTWSWKWSWINDLGLHIHLSLDGFAIAMVAVIYGLGALVLWYSSAYFPDHHAYGKFVGLFLVFASAMTGLVMSADLFTMFLFWEVTSVVSFLLIGMNDESASARSAALRALLVTGAGGLCLLIGVALFQISVGTSEFAGLIASDGRGGMFATAAMFALLGALTKSAQFPFHFWLPGAMSAPTPVSAYLHSATMVKAGIVLMARLSPAVSHVDVWRWSVIVLGGITMVLGGVRAMRQRDAKLLLAHSTVSQLGFLTILVGMGNPIALYAGVAHLIAHAVFKAGLFLSVGIVDHETGTRDIGELNGVGRQLRVVAWLAGISAASMAGMIPFLGFVTKEKALATLLKSKDGIPLEQAVALAAIIIGSVFSVAYSVRLIKGMFGVKPDQVETHVHHAPSLGLVVPVAATVVVTVGAALSASWWGGLMKKAATALDSNAIGKLVLWPGINTALVTSILILLVGALVGLRVPLAPNWPRIPLSGERMFQATYDGLLAFAGFFTRYSQSGSLIAYNMVVFGIVALALGVPTLTTLQYVDADFVLADSAAQAALVVLAIAFTLATTFARARFTAALVVGGLGFSSAALFAVFGAPDLALTQLLVECLVIVVLLLVMRKLPTRFERDINWMSRGVRVAVSVFVGIAVATFAVVASSSRTAPSVGDDYLARSVPEGFGKNVVNVILVDFRGVDTLGEVTVLLVAALGIVNLFKQVRHHRVGQNSEVAQ